MDAQKEVDRLCRERLLPSPRIAFILFLASYAIIAITRLVTDSPIPFLAGVLTTTVLAVHLAKAVLVRVLRRDLAGRRGGPIMTGPLIYPVVLLVFFPIYLPLLAAFTYAYWQVG